MAIKIIKEMVASEGLRDLVWKERDVLTTEIIHKIDLYKIYMRLRSRHPSIESSFKEIAEELKNIFKNLGVEEIHSDFNTNIMTIKLCSQSLAVLKNYLDKVYQLET